MDKIYYILKLYEHEVEIDEFRYSKDHRELVIIALKYYEKHRDELTCFSALVIKVELFDEVTNDFKAIYNEQYRILDIIDIKRDQHRLIQEAKEHQQRLLDRMKTLTNELAELRENLNCYKNEEAVIQIIEKS